MHFCLSQVRLGCERQSTTEAYMRFAQLAAIQSFIDCASFKIDYLPRNNACIVSSVVPIGHLRSTMRTIREDAGGHGSAKGEWHQPLRRRGHGGREMSPGTDSGTEPVAQLLAYLLNVTATGDVWSPETFPSDEPVPVNFEGLTEPAWGETFYGVPGSRPLGSWAAPPAPTGAPTPQRPPSPPSATPTPADPAYLAWRHWGDLAVFCIVLAGLVFALYRRERRVRQCASPCKRSLPLSGPAIGPLLAANGAPPVFLSHPTVGSSRVLRFPPALCAPALPPKKPKDTRALAFPHAGSRPLMASLSECWCVSVRVRVRVGVGVGVGVRVRVRGLGSSSYMRA